MLLNVNGFFSTRGSSFISPSVVSECEKPGSPLINADSSIRYTTSNDKPCPPTVMNLLDGRCLVPDATAINATANIPVLVTECTGDLLESWTYSTTGSTFKCVVPTIPSLTCSRPHRNPQRLTLLPNP